MTEKNVEHADQTTATNSDGSETPTIEGVEVTYLEGQEADDALSLLDDPLFGEKKLDAIEPSSTQNKVNNNIEGVEVSEMSLEDFEQLSQISVDVKEIAEIAQTEGDPRQAKAKAATIANAFLIGDPIAQEKMEEAQAIVNEGSVTKITDWVAQKGKGVMAMIALAASLGALAPTPANAGGHNNLFNQIQGVINPINRGVAAQEQYRGIEQQQASLRLQITQIEARKKLLSVQTTTNTEVSTIENRVAGSTQPRQLEASYRAQKATLNVQKITAKERFLAKSNPSESDRARYDAEIANTQAREAQIDGAYEVAIARESGQRSIRGATTDSTRVNAQIQMEQLTQQQDRLAEQIQKLELQKYTKGATDIGTIFRR